MPNPCLCYLLVWLLQFISMTALTPDCPNFNMPKSLLPECEPNPREILESHHTHFKKSALAPHEGTNELQNSVGYIQSSTQPSPSLPPSPANCTPSTPHILALYSPSKRPDSNWETVLSLWLFPPCGSPSQSIRETETIITFKSLLNTPLFNISYP